MPNNPHKREEWIDTVKGLAIILVVLQHSCGSLYNSNIYHIKELQNIISFIGIFHMGLFMILSGYCFCLAYYGNGNTGIDIKRADRQAVNLILLYLIYSVVRYVFKMLFNNQANNPIERKDIFFIFFQPIDELWFLYALIALYLIAILIFKITSSRSLLTLQVIVTGSVMSLIYIITGLEIPGGMTRVAHYFAYFFFGITVWLFTNVLHRKDAGDCKKDISLKFEYRLRRYLITD